MLNLIKFNKGDYVRISSFPEPIGYVSGSSYLNHKGETVIDVAYVECGRIFYQPCFVSTLVLA